MSIIQTKTSVLFRFSLLIINEGDICGVSSTKKFDKEMFVQVPITFFKSEIVFILSLYVPIEYFKVSPQKLFFFCTIFVKSLLNISIFCLFGLDILI